MDHCGEMAFSVIEVANSMGWESHIVRSELNGLQYNDRGTSDSTLNGARSTVLVEFSGLAFHVRAPGDFMPEERDHICEFLTKKVKSQEEREVEKLHLLHAVLQSISQNSNFNCERDDAEYKTRMEESVPAVGARQPQSTARYDSQNISAVRASTEHFLLVSEFRGNHTRAGLATGQGRCSLSCCHPQQPPVHREDNSMNLSWHS